MAVLNPRDVKISRRKVRLWLVEWREMNPLLRPNLRVFITTKLQAENHQDTEISRPGEQMPELKALVDLIIEDVDSYT